METSHREPETPKRPLIPPRVLASVIALGLLLGVVLDVVGPSNDAKQKARFEILNGLREEHAITQTTTTTTTSTPTTTGGH